MIADTVCERLQAMEIEFDRVTHPPKLTIAECAETDAILHATTAKNYFLTTKNRKHFYLLITRPEAHFVTKDVSKQIASPRLSFAPEDELLARLQVHPGSVSPLALIFDSARDVQLLVDSRLHGADRIAFHPCDNTQTVAMRGSDFFDRFLPEIGCTPMDVEIGDSE